MLEGRSSAKLLCAIVLLIAPWSSPAVSAADKDAKKDGGKAAGILIDLKPDWITVKADGEDEPVKYSIDISDKKVVADRSGVLIPHRVHLTYETNGDSRQLVSIKPQHVPKSAGTVTGEVVKHYGWWIEIKPKKGVSDGYALNYGEKDKDLMAKFNELKAGDSVTIKFRTDAERHRIQTIHKNATPTHKSDAPPGTPSKE